MSRYKLKSAFQQRDFDDFETAKCFAYGLPERTETEIQDLEARNGELAIYTIIAGIDGYISRRYLPTNPID